MNLAIIFCEVSILGLVFGDVSEAKLVNTPIYTSLCVVIVCQIYV